VQLSQDAEHLKAALAEDPVQVTQQVISVTLTSSADAMFPSGGWQIPSDAPLLNRMLPTLSQLKSTSCCGRLHGQRTNRATASGDDLG
jgi:hypothetical protein